MGKSEFFAGLIIVITIIFCALVYWMRPNENQEVKEDASGVGLLLVLSISR